MRGKLGTWTVALGLGAMLVAVPGSQHAEPAAGRAGDWPQLLGPERSGAVEGTGLFRDGRPPELQLDWRRPLGKGYSFVSVLGETAYTLASDGTSDYALALEAASGKELWRTRLDRTYEGHGGSDDGPTSTPTVTPDAVYAVSPWGKLFALDRAEGRILWRHDLVAELGAVAPGWSFATSPLVVGELVIVQVGGVGPNNLVAFRREGGEVAWSVRRETRIRYSSPVLTEIGGVPQVVVAAEKEVYAVSPATGELLWNLPAEQSDKLMPVVLPGGRLFVPSWREGLLVRVERGGEGFRATVAWTTPYLKGSYSPAVYHRGHLYGFNGSFLTCLDPATGEPVWRERAYEGSLILVDGHLLVWGDGALRIAAASPRGYRELARIDLSAPRTEGILAPVYAAGRVFLRPPRELVAVELAAGG